MTEPSEFPDPLPPGYRLQDRYLIESELPPQRMGRAYKARDLALHEAVAINVLHVELRDTQHIRRFRWHFRTARQKHRGQVYDYGECLGVPFVAVKFEEDRGAVVDVADE